MLGPRSRRIIVEYAVTIAAAALVAFLIQAFAVKPFRIPTPSMADTVRTGDRVLIDRIEYHFRAVHRGDVIVFGGQGPIPLLKRVVGVPGDTLSLRDGELYVNGQPAPDSYVRRVDGVIEPTKPGPNAAEPWSLSRPFTVPAGQYFVMGDNRTESADSRFWGTVARSDIIGRAFVVYWPPGQIGGL
jgi:signal peptidase I